MRLILLPMRKFFRVLFSLLVMLAIARGLWAVEITDDRDRKYSGQILDEDEGMIYLDTGGGLISLNKSQIKTMDGKPYGKVEAQAPETAPPAKPGYLEVPGETVAAKGYAVQIGNSGLTPDELSIYTRGLNAGLERYNSLSGNEWGTKSLPIRQAIEDEIVFQEALLKGIHKQGQIRKNILQEYQAQQTLGPIDPKNFAEADMRAFYENHKAELVFPAEHVFSILHLGGSKAEIESAYAKAKANPDAAAGWKKGGWIKDGDSLYLPITDKDRAQIDALKKGQISPLIYEGGGFGAFDRGNAFVFRCDDYKPPVSKTFEQAKERVRYLMIQQRQKANTGELQSRVGSEAALFDEAVKAGTHRSRHIRSQIINEYLAQTHKTLGQVASAAKDRYPIIFAA